LLGLLAAIAAGQAWYLRSFLPARGEAPADPDGVARDLIEPPQDWVLWALMGLVVILRAYPLTLPIHHFSGGDEGVHMGLPALPFKVWARHLPLAHPLAFWSAAWLAYRFRKSLWRVLRTSLAALMERRSALAAAGLLAAAYAFGVFELISHFIPEGHPSLARDLLRFPPLSRLIRLLVYAALGVSNLTGRLPEFLFFLASGVLFYKLGAFRSLTVARLAVLAYWFLPPFAYYSMRGSQTNGEAFFYLLTCYFFAHWARGGAGALLHWAALCLTAGSMYRYTLPVLGLILAAQVALDSALRERVGRRTALELGGMLLLGIAPWTLANYAYGLRPYEPTGQGLTWASLLAPAGSLPGAVSWPVALLMAAGLLLALLRGKDSFQRLLLVWFFGYYLFISRDLGYDIRLALPFYLPLIFWAVEALDLLAGLCSRAFAGGGYAPLPWDRGILRSLLGSGLSLYLLAITTWFRFPGVQPEFTLRRSLETEYLPLGEAAKFVEGLAEGTRVLGVDSGRGALSLYLPRPEAVEWRQADSREIASLEALRGLCLAEGIEVVMYAAGTLEALGTRRNDALFDAFERDAAWFAHLATVSLGRNKIVFKRVGRRRL